MKRFLLFAGNYYYPSGGTGDLQGEYTTLDEATKEGKRLLNLDHLSADHKEWGHILDIKTGEQVNLTSY